MRKLHKLAAGVALAVASTASMAGTFQALTSEAVGVEAATTGSLTADIAGIVLNPNTQMSSDNRLFIELKDGATFGNSTYVLFQSLGGAVTADTTEFVLITPTPAGATKLEFRAASQIDATHEYVLSASSSNAAAGIDVNLPALSAGSAVRIDANADDSFGTFDFYTEINLFEYANEFSGNVDGVADGIIDVNDARLSFVGGAKTDTIGLEFKEANATNGVSLNDDDKVDITLSGDMSDIESITLKTGAVSRGTFTIDTAANTATFSASASDAFAAASTTLDVTVNGTGALATRTFTIQADLNFDAETDKNLVAASTSAGEWSINGLQAKVSHMSLNASGFISWLKVVNEGTTAAEISADIIWTLADGTEGSVSSATLGTVDAGGIFTVSEASILAAMGSPTGVVDASLTVTVAGQVDLVHLTAEKKASDGRVSIPVYYNTAGSNPRNWVQ